ncbi:MAG: pyridoxamine 5'-phosphate oxidase family protein [Actinobacteria bacterium]|nr:pyridoxamine 5'-phosphate oxidase family protein [Actinomycetota bacterium]
MAKLPSPVLDAWKKRSDPAILATVDTEGVPNAIYVTYVRIVDDEMVIVADNYFDKTKKNILAGSVGSLLFITSDKESYQLKGAIEYQTDGPLFESMKSWNGPDHPGHAAAVIRVEEAYSGATRLL